MDRTEEQAFEKLTQSYEPEPEVEIEVDIDTLTNARKKLISGLEGAVTSIVLLAKHADNERIRVDCAKFIIERFMPSGKGDQQEAWTELLARIHGSPKNPEPQPENPEPQPESEGE